VEAVNGLTGQLEKLAASLRQPAPDFRDLAAAAYLLHHLYTGLENTFEQVSRTFENHVVDAAQWHKDVLSKMFLEIPTLRPAVLPEFLRPLLDEMRGFRHVFRHAYGTDLDAERLARLVQRWTAHAPAVAAALDCFRDWLLAQAATN
jgi:hypothetical protein